MRLLCAACFSFGLLLGCGNVAPSGMWIKESAKLTSPGAMTPASAPLFTPTYDGSGQATEPTVAYFPNGWQGHFYWMVMSPYPGGDDRFENPSVLVSEDGQNWVIPPGVVNPLWFPKNGNLSDATVVHDDISDQMFLYFQNEIHGPEYRESLLRSTSADGIRWSKPQVLMSGEGTHSLSPTVAQIDGIFYLWMVNSDVGCASQSSTVVRRSSVDGANWSKPDVLSLHQPGFVIWHINIIAVPSDGQFMSLVAAYPLGSDCGHTKLFFANSHDGFTWQTYPTPILEQSDGWQSQEIYRSSLVYDPAKSLFRVWYSASDAVTGEWRIAYTEKLFEVE